MSALAIGALAQMLGLSLVLTLFAVPAYVVCTWFFLRQRA
jgi:hypothetical protein